MLRLTVCVLLLSASAGFAQAPTEHVTVTGTRSEEVLRGFVKSITAPTRMAGKIARWETPICPYAIGVKPEATKFVVDRLKAVAAEIGAPVSTDEKCNYNIEVVFTRTPQALLDNMKKDQPGLLGYYDSSSERDRLATVTQPIQAWYTTATRDLRGHVEVDGSKTAGGGRGLQLLLPCTMLGEGVGSSMSAPQRGALPVPPMPRLCSRYLPYATKVNVTGSPLGDGVNSMLFHIVIVADTGKLQNFELGAASDYIAMLALSQFQAPQDCPVLPSITGLLTAACEQKPSSLTPNDTAYLRGLYQMRGDMALNIQRSEIVGEMQKSGN